MAAAAGVCPNCMKRDALLVSRNGSVIAEFVRPIAFTYEESPIEAAMDSNGNVYIAARKLILKTNSRDSSTFIINTNIR